ncbi:MULTISPECIES: TrbI/VirB10 family protein [Ralstonia]|uniref:Conjugal transfer protein TrbI n=2 Tax=Ralstonia TaxID=48736 RepID=A0AAD2BU31_9RALS|nr:MULTISPECIES: TrbI/VirB10 family protein [Ralstonia]NMV39920.1 hypothetical protein [Ralstonia insidiosa]CAJ0807467.1 hypothetical protein R77560_04579 [Ralstonia sp. LMG 18095]
MAATTNDPFASPDTVQLKGKVTSLTRLSRKAKLLMSLVGVVGVIGIVAMIMTVGDEQPATTTGASGDAANGAKGKEVLMASADALGKDIPDGQAAAVADKLGVDAAPVGGVDVGHLQAASGVVVPRGAVGAASVPATQPTGNVPTVPAVNAGGVAGQPAGATGETREQAEARRAKDERDQKLRDARFAGIESGATGDPAALAAASLASMQAGGANDQISNAVARATAALDSMQGKGAAGPMGGGPFGAGAEQDDVNKQVRKETFLRDGGASSGSTYLQETLKKPLGKYEIKAGWNIPMVLECGINSDLPGQTCARVTENVYDTATGRHLLIPQQTKAIGTYDSRIAVGQSRLLIVWTRLIFPDGTSFVLQGMPGTDGAGNAGFDGDVNNHYAKIFLGAIMMSAISAGAQLSQPQQSQTGNAAPSAGQTLSASLGQQLGQVSSSMINRNMQVQPTITQAPGYRFNITVTKDLLFPAPFGK